jgi:hypothetical protein
MKRAILVALLVLVVAVGLSAQVMSEPYSVKGDKLGETATEWLASSPTHKDWTCMPSDASRIVEGQTVDCSISFRLKDTYAGRSMSDESVSFVAKDGKLLLYRVSMDFIGRMDYVAADDILAAFNEKFGTGIDHKTPLQNGFGARFEKNTWDWTNGVSSAELTYVPGDQSYPSVVFLHLGLAREIKERQDKAEQTKARSDM